jgi:hypothetical protein
MSVPKRSFCVVLAAGALLACAGSAQEPDKQFPKFWDNDRRAGAGAVAEMVGVHEPLALVAMRLRAKAEIVWGVENEPIPDMAPPLDERILSRVKDNHDMPRVAGRLRDEWRPWEAANYDIYCQAIRHAALTPAEAFAKSAQDNSHVVWGDLFREPWKYRGQVIPVKGRLKMLRRRDPPLPDQDVVKFLYEGWVFTDTPGSNPDCVILTELPGGMKEGESITYKVEFDGYFLMRYRYLTSGKGWRDTLLFVAPTLRLVGPAARKGGDDGGDIFHQLSGTILTGMMIVIGATMLLVVGLGWWFRRGDRRFERHLSDVRAGMFAESELSSGQQPGDAITGIRAEQPPLATRPPPEEPDPGRP